MICKLANGNLEEWWGFAGALTHIIIAVMIEKIECQLYYNGLTLWGT